MRDFLPLLLVFLGMFFFGCQKPEYLRSADASDQGYDSQRSDYSDDLDGEENLEELASDFTFKTDEAEPEFHGEDARLEEEFNREAQAQENVQATDGSSLAKCLSGQFDSKLDADIIVDGSVGPIAYHVTGDGSLEIKSTGKKALFKLNASVLSAHPAIARQIAESRMQAQSGTRILNFVSNKEFEELKKNDPTWARINCTIVPVKSQVFVLDGKKAVVEYEPALPFAIIPTAKEDYFDEELGGPLEFKDIRVKLVQVPTHLKEVKSGDVLTGQAILKPIPANDCRLSTDRGFRLEFDFGSIEKHYAVGLAGAWFEFFVSTQDRDYDGLSLPLYVNEESETEILFHR